MEEFLKEKDKIKLDSYDEKYKNNQPIRLLIIGSSGSGKTTLLLNFIYKRLIPYTNLYVFSKSLEQPAYIKLQQRFKNIESNINKKVANFFGSCEDIISLNDCKPNSLIVFDDCILENQDKIKEYFVMGRHKNISCIYLSQCYSKVDIQLIRNNLNMLCLF
uniref:ATPase/DNA packaging protein n=1 Tax=Vibrio cholerae TaxID=666 RepID=UPI00111BEAD6